MRYNKSLEVSGSSRKQPWAPGRWVVNEMKLSFPLGCWALGALATY
jgi:hypothetical protein